jgi:hypothetical protein
MACHSYEPLPGYANYARGERPASNLRFDGFYCDQGSDGKTDGHTILFFYENGLCYRSWWNTIHDPDSAVTQLRSFYTSPYGHNYLYEYGSGWGMYTADDDTITMAYYAYATRGTMRRWVGRLHVNPDGTLHELPYSISSKLPKWRRDLEKVHGPPLNFVFHTSLWKPDPEPFFHHNKGFIRSQR